MYISRFNIQAVYSTCICHSLLIVNFQCNIYERTVKLHSQITILKVPHGRVQPGVLGSGGTAPTLTERVAH